MASMAGADLNTLNKRTRFLLLLKPPQKTSINNKGVLRYNRSDVIHYLTESLKDSEIEFAQCLKDFKINKNNFKMVSHHWINRSVVMESTFSLLQNNALKQILFKKCPIVQSIHSLKSLESPEKPSQIQNASLSSSFFTNLYEGEEDSLEAYHFKSIGLDRVLKEMPELRGAGIVIGEIDTGVDANHPTLQNRVNQFLDGTKRMEAPPKDKGGHGTHVAGILVGEDIKNKIRYGIAPDAKLRVASAMEDNDTLLYAMEWMLKDPNVHVVNNSWSVHVGTDPAPFYKAIESWEAAGVLPVFSVGNAGPKLKSVTVPHEHPLVFAVGATDKTDSVIGMSSRGPGLYLGNEIQKPDLVAPGDEIYSAFPYRRSGSMSGSSMAAPHVSGAVAILLQMNPQLTPKELRFILKNTAKKGKTGEENAYGAGNLDLYEAVQFVKKELFEKRFDLRSLSPIEYFKNQKNNESFRTKQEDRFLLP